jgi:vitamin B12 transporter
MFRTVFVPSSSNSSTHLSLRAARPPFSPLPLREGGRGGRAALALCLVLSASALVAEETPAPAPTPAPVTAPAAKTEAAPVKPPQTDAQPPAAPTAPGTQAQTVELPEVVVTAERVPTPVSQTGVSITVINGKEEEEIRQVHDLSETLRQVPGITVSQSGHQGDFTTLFTRGGNSNQTLLLVDNFKVNRQGGNYDFGKFDPIRVDHIEVVRGPSSSLFGTDAVTGVVNVVSAKGEGCPELTTSAAGGTFRTDRETLSLQGSEGKFSYNIGASRINSGRDDFINSALDQINYAARLDFDFNCDHSLKLILRGTEFTKGFYENSASGYGPKIEPQDSNDRFQVDDLLAGLEYRGHILPIWTTTLRVGNYLYDQDVHSFPTNPDSTVLGFPQTAGHTGTRERHPQLDWQNDVTAYSTCDEKIKDVVTLGATFEEERFHQSDTIFGNNADVSRNNSSVYFQNRLSLYDRAFITGGVRREQNEQFGEFTTGRGDVAILVPESDSKLHASIGNAFRAPSFFEFFSASGNPNLTPERNFAYDAGIDQHFWNNRILLGATAFRNNFKDLVDFSLTTSKFSNLKTAESRGLELVGAIDPIKQLTLRATGTFMHTEDQNGQQLARRPNSTVTAEAIARPIENLDLSLSFINEGSRPDIGPASGNPFARVRAAAYSRLDAAVNYRFFTHWRAFCRVQNLTDEHYEDTKTFPAASMNVLAGIEFNWRF